MRHAVGSAIANSGGAVIRICPDYVRGASQFGAHDAATNNFFPLSIIAGTVSKSARLNWHLPGPDEG